MIIASIDIGTNTILMLVAEIADSQLITLRNEHSIPRLGKDVVKGADISDEKINKLIEILKNYKTIADGLNAEKIICTGTNAFRYAANSEFIINKVKSITGIDIEVITGEKEAAYAFLGATEGVSEKHNLVIDIGGGSTELVFGKGKEILFRRSFNAGVVTGTEKYFKNDPPTEIQINSFLEYLSEEFNDIPEIIKKPECTIAIAGTPTSLASIKMNLMEYNEDLIEGAILKKNELNDLINELSHYSSQQILERYKSVSPGREDVLLSGSVILLHLMNILEIEELKVSTKGVRYGAIYYNYLQ